MPQAPNDRNGGDDAICFTSGPAGAPFSAGVIHAWLAIDREPPLVAAGISMGAISAAAMRRVYQELAHAPAGAREQKRWEWYRRYLNAIIQNPTAALWNAVPDPVDFFATIPPVVDLSVPEALRESSEDARRHYYLLTRLGVWLANLPLRVSSLATVAVMYVRKKEGYGNPLRREWLFYWNALKLILALSWHILFSPSMIAEAPFHGHPRRKSFHPLFGGFWLINLGADLAMFGLIALVAVTFHRWLRFVGQWQGVAWLPAHFSAVRGAPGAIAVWVISILLALIVAAFLVVAAFSLAAPIFRKVREVRKQKQASEEPDARQKSKDWGNEFLRKWLFAPLDITKALLHPYEAQRQLYDLFLADAPAFASQPPLSSDVHLLAVCAALEQKEQVWLKEDVDVVEALTAATAIPGIFPPCLMQEDKIRSHFDEEQERTSSFQIIDGSAIRTNPIPAFFGWCKQTENRSYVDRMEARSEHSPSLHVVYNVPIGYNGSVQDAPPLSCPDIVDSAELALQLEKRRDTRQEVRQTNYASRLEAVQRAVSGTSAKEFGPFVIYADEIAPEKDIGSGDLLSPRPKKLMKIVSSGCRATLESLYRDKIHALGGSAPVVCSRLLATVAKHRDPTASGHVTGLPEVCGGCTGLLEYRAPAVDGAPPPGIIRSFGNKGGSAQRHVLAEQFAHLLTEAPKVVFLGSGGVFRGAFHIGVIAAMAQAELYPDLVIGASVGALMGGALCNITAGPQENEIDVLFRLTLLFLNVDREVALTRTLKNAFKQLGTRARKIRLSPSELTRMVAHGSQADPGFAATGAPPALIDALSSLFMIPHRETGDIASQFVAGHIGKATGRFLRQLRKETLASFNIQSAVMGISMLAEQTRGLLGQGTHGVDLASVQPFQGPEARKKVSFFCTTSFLNAGISILLGRDFLTADPTWDAVYAGLSSSAFPAVFAPRTEADFLPGVGRTDRFFADGGLFDNLPFFPAIEILSALQLNDGKTTSEEMRRIFRTPASERSEAEESLRTELVKEIHREIGVRGARPHLFIAAGLNAKPERSGTYDTLFQIKKRADSLSVESKTEAFRRAASKALEVMKSIASPENADGVSNLGLPDLEFLEGSVAAEVVSISPRDADHINPTFAFCHSTGLKQRRVQQSIADGCFQSLAEFARNAYIENLLQPEQRISRLKSAIPITGAPAPRKVHQACPFFLKGGKPFACPFTRSPNKAYVASAKKQVFDIWDTCSNDPAHLGIQGRWT